MPRPKRSELALLRAAAELWDTDGETGYLARLFTQTSLPYRDPGDVAAWGRRNGDLVLTVQPGMTIDENGEPRSIGYPFGTVPPPAAHVAFDRSCTYPQPRAHPRRQLSDFMRQLGMTPTGGRNGTITRLAKQMERLFQASLSVRWEGTANRRTGARLNVASAYDLWWTDREPDRPSLLPSTVQLSGEFFKEVTEHPRAAQPRCSGAQRLGATPRHLCLAHLPDELSPSSHRDPPGGSLRTQFGSQLAETKQGRSQFRRDFERHMREVLLVYRDANVETSPAGVVLLPSPPTHVARRALQS